MTEISVRGAGPASVVTYRFGGREYPMKTERSCKVCMSPHRFDIEEQIVSGRTYRRIAESLPEDAEIHERNVASHYKAGHMPLEVSMTRQMVEQRARRVGKRIEDDERSLIDGVALMEVVVQRTFEAIAKGKVQPDVGEGLRAAKMLADLGEYDDAGVDQQAYVEAFTVYQEEAQRIMGPEAFEAFGEALAANPVLAALARRYEQAQGGTVEGEVEEEEPGLSGSLDSDG